MNPFDSVVGWIRAGYPQGVDRTDFPPLLALLTRVLDEKEITRVAQTLAQEAGIPAVTEQQIQDAIAGVTEQTPTTEETNQVAARIASAGWPLAVSLSDR